MPSVPQPARLLTPVLLLACLPACPQDVPGSGQFSHADAGQAADAIQSEAAGDTGPDLPAANDLVFDPGLEAVGPELTLPETAEVAAETSADLPAAELPGPEIAADAPCSCAFDTDCGGQTLPCKQAVCACFCKLTALPEGSPCQGGTCKAGSCVPSPGKVKAVAAGYDFSCALDGSGKVRCWGANGDGQLGVAKPAESLAPLEVPTLAGVVELAARNRHACARVSGKAFCWGDNFWGQVGSSLAQGDAFTPLEADDLTKVVQLALTTDSSLALREDGAVWGWGKANYGIFASESTKSLPVPDKTGAGTGNLWLGAGNDHACAIRAGSKLFCWGRGDWGQIGDGEDGATNVVTAPFEVPGVLAARVACGFAHTCAVAPSTGQVWCWGRGLEGQIGPAVPQDMVAPKPTAVTGLAGVAEIAAGDNHNCALDKDGKLLCWGENEDGQLGLNPLLKSESPEPHEVDLGGKAVHVAAGSEHTCAVREDGAVLCWGANDAGQLGSGDKKATHKPVLVGLGG